MALLSTQVLPDNTLEEFRIEFNKLVTDVSGLSLGNTFDTQIIFEGTTDDTFETAISVTDPTADRSIVFPNASGNVLLDSTTIALADSVELQFGDGTDLKIFHDGSNSIIRDNGIGALFLEGDTVAIRDEASSETMANFASDGAVTLYHNNVAKLATASTGVEVSSSGNTQIGITSTSGIGSMEIGSAASNAAFIDLKTPTSDDYDVRLSSLAGGSGGSLTISGGTFSILGSGETMAAFADDGAVSLYYDNSAVLATASGGVSVTGTLTTSGILKTDDTTDATSTTDGSLQTDGGLSVAKDIVVGDDIKLLSDAAALHFGTDSEVTLTHYADNGLRLKHTATADDKPIVFVLQTGETDIAASDVLGSIRWQAPDEGTGTDAILVAGAIDVISEGDFSSSNNAAKMAFRVGSSGTAAEKMSLSSAGLLTIADDFIIKDAGTIGSASDPDAISIASNGAIVMSGATVTVSGALGVAGLCSFSSDLELDHDGAFISFGANDDVTITHDPDDGLFLKSIATGDNNPFLLTLQTGETDIAANDVLGKIQFQAPDEGTGTDALLVAAAIEAVSVGDFSATSNATNLNFMTAVSEEATTKLTLESDGDLHIRTDSASLMFGSDAEVTLTHVHNDGLLLNSDMQLQFRDSAINIRSDADGDLDINADDEIELNSTLIDINGNVEISGTLAQVGVATFTGSPIVTGSGNKSITITSSDGIASMEIGAAAGSAAFIDLKTPSSDDVDLRIASLAAGSGGAISVSSGTFSILGSGETMATFADDGAVSLHYDNAVKIATQTNGIDITGELQLSTHLDMTDSGIIKLGSDDDLTIKHDGSNGSITNGTGDLYIQDGGGNIYIQAKTGEQSIDVFADGAVELFHDDTKKFTTDASGVNVIQTSAGGLTVGADHDTSNTSANFICAEGTSETNPAALILKGVATNNAFFQQEVFHTDITSAAEVSRVTGSGVNGFRAYIKVMTFGHTGSVGNGHAIKEVYWDGAQGGAPVELSTTGGGGNNPDITFDVGTSNVIIIKIASGDGSNTYRGVAKVEYMFPLDFSASTWVVS